MVKLTDILNTAVEAMTEERVGELVVPNAGQQFNGDDFRALRKPGVYVFLSGEKPLYIGMSKCLLRRVGFNDHHAWQAIRDCDRVMLYPCRSVEAAEELENLLIVNLSPKYNKKRRNWNINRLLATRSSVT